VLRHRGAHPILILLAPAQQADIGVFDPQEDSIPSVRLAGTLYHLRRLSVVAAQDRGGSGPPRAGGSEIFQGGSRA
jgi:hypothetical protein